MANAMHFGRSSDVGPLRKARRLGWAAQAMRKYGTSAVNQNIEAGKSGNVGSVCDSA